MNDNLLKTEGEFWNRIAGTWSLQNKNPVVGWYNFHNSWADYDDILFDGVDTKEKYALEYGCGPARNIIKFGHPDWGFECIDGVDIAPKNIENAHLNIAESRQKNGYPTFPSRLWVNDGQHIEADEDFYDIVFSVICLQHIQSHEARRTIFREIYRVLHPAGVFCAQMGFGPGHPRSVDYYYNGETHFDGDVRVEDPKQLEDDLREAGFTQFRYVLRPPCKDEHPSWIWFQAKLS